MYVSCTQPRSRVRTAHTSHPASAQILPHHLVWAAGCSSGESSGTGQQQQPSNILIALKLSIAAGTPTDFRIDDAPSHLLADDRGIWTSVADCDGSGIVAMVSAERDSALKLEVHNDQGLVAAGSIPIADLWQVRAMLTAL